jgi:hypothetical protein
VAGRGEDEQFPANRAQSRVPGDTSLAYPRSAEDRQRAPGRAAMRCCQYGGTTERPTSATSPDTDRPKTRTGAVSVRGEAEDRPADPGAPPAGHVGVPWTDHIGLVDRAGHGESVRGDPRAQAAAGHVDVVVRTGAYDDRELDRRQVEDLDPPGRTGSRTGWNTVTSPEPSVSEAPGSPYGLARLFVPRSQSRRANRAGTLDDRRP